MSWSALRDPWVVIGLCGQMIFAARFLIQWISSERKQESHIPIAFWYCSILGGVILFSYAWHKQDPVFILGQSMGLFVYLRNLMLIHKKNQLEGASSAS